MKKKIRLIAVISKYAGNTIGKFSRRMANEPTSDRIIVKMKILKR